MTSNKNIEEKRYLRVLTKNIEEMQPQLTSAKVYSLILYSSLTRIFIKNLVAAKKE